MGRGAGDVMRRGLVASEDGRRRGRRGLLRERARERRDVRTRRRIVEA
jgi:hypothetical protein